MSTQATFLRALAQKFGTDLDYATPLDLARAYDPTYISTPALELLCSHLTDAAENPSHRKVISFAPQEGKTTTSAIAFPLWLLTQQRHLRIAICSYSKDLAEEQVRSARNIVAEHPDLFPYTIDKTHAAKDSWRIEGARGGVFAVGVNGGFTGKPADVVIVDDPHGGIVQAESKAERERVKKWWTGTVTARFAASTIVIIVQTRWHKDDLAGYLLDRNPEAFEFVRVPAQADHDPSKGETDILGRAPGEYMISARGRTQEQWEQRKRDAGSIAWSALYQGKPIAEGGELFDMAKIKDYDWTEIVTQTNGRCYVPPAQYDQIGMSWDMTFKGGATSDYVVGQVWLKRGASMYLLDQVRGQWSFTESVEQVKRFSEKWRQAQACFIEDKANGSAIIDTLSRTRPGVIGVNPQGGKEARARAITPFIEAGNILLPSIATAPFDVDSLRMELADFPQGKHDDTVDAMTQAITSMMIDRKKKHGYANIGLD